MQTFQNVTRICSDCGVEHVWDARDQRYAHAQGFLPPKRCGHCRLLAKQRRQQAQRD